MRKSQSWLCRSRTTDGRVSRHPDPISRRINLVRRNRVSPCAATGTSLRKPSGRPREDNLVWKAAISDCFSSIRGNSGVSMTLRKRIPAGAGLGGGSSNAAVTLLGCAASGTLTFPIPICSPLAASLGSDVPFFLNGGTALGIGRGETSLRSRIPPSEHLVVIFPGPRFHRGSLSISEFGIDFL